MKVDLAVRRASFLSLLCVWTLTSAALITAQVVLLPGQAPARDGSSAPPTERRVPVGTATISGTVVAADTGRPVRNARVSVSAQIQVVMDGATAGRGDVVLRGVPAAGMRGVSGGVAVSGVGRSIATDASGQFSFARLPAGQYQISISHNQFLQLNYGQRRFGGQGRYIAVAEGQQLNIKASMYRGAVISGTVLSPEGEPMQSVQVRGWRYVRVNGFKRLQGAGYAQTDDRGNYRMFNLQPGEYLISAMPSPDYTSASNAQAEQTERAITTGQVLPPTIPGGPPTVSVPIAQPQTSGPINIQPQFLPTFSPSSPAAAGAEVVTVAAGEESKSVDVVTRLTQASTVQVEVMTQLDAGVTVQMQLVSDDPSTEMTELGSMRPDPAGKVYFRGLRPGKYTVLAQTVAEPPRMTIVNGVAPAVPPQMPVLNDDQKMFGRASVSVDGDPLTQVSLSLQPAKKVSGMLVFDMKQPPDLTRARVMVSVTPAPAPYSVYMSGPLPQVQVEPDGRFTLTGIMPGRYMMRTSGSGVLRSAMAGGQDTLDFALDVPVDRDVTGLLLTLTDGGTELSGILADAAGKPTPDYTIVVASAENRYWLPGSRRIVMTRPGPDGKYTVRNLPAGQYFLAAVIDPEQGIQYDPEFLKEISGAGITVTINEGAKTTQDVRVK